MLYCNSCDAACTQRHTFSICAALAGRNQPEGTTVTQKLVLSPTEARRLAVAAQRLAGPTPPPTTDGILDLLRDLRCLQIDPIRAVEVTQLLVLWSRLGPFDPAHLDRLLWDEAQLFEYWAHCASIVLTEDYPLFAPQMLRRRTPHPDGPGWVEKNEAMRRHVLDRLAGDGPLAINQIDDLAEFGYASTGWNNGRNVGMMLDHLWMRGEIMVARRQGTRRFWDLAERCLPEWAPRHDLPGEEVTALAAQHALRALGIATPRHITQHFTRGRYPNLPAALARLAADGAIVPAQIVEDGGAWPGEWWVHADRLPLLDEVRRAWSPRTTLLSPFDNLICDRARTEQLFDFFYRVEIYTPLAKRQYGYYVLPILHGDRLIGRIDPKLDRKTRRLTVHAVHAEPGAPADRATGAAVAAAVESLAGFLGATAIDYPGDMPPGWRQ